MIAHGQIDQAIEYCADPENESLFGEVVLAGLERYKGSEFGFAEYKAAVEEAGEDQTGRLYRKTEVLGLIGSIAPMLGLTGTVLGMIKAFNTIASTEGAARPAELAGGISQALVTTLMGLVVAIPTMVAFSYFRNKIDSIIAEAGKRVEQVLMPLGRRK
jgi:biopolymer transport protein ExbB